MTNYKRKFLITFLPGIILFICAIYLSSCSTQKYISSVSYDFKSESGKPDYSNLNYWAANPYKYNPSENVPYSLKGEAKDTLADVFFIYPTTYTDKKMPMGWNADIDNKEINRKTDDKSILYQASVFNKYCRVFAPRYRQANLEAFYTKDKQRGEAALDTAYSDVRAAFI